MRLRERWKTENRFVPKFAGIIFSGLLCNGLGLVELSEAAGALFSEFKNPRRWAREPLWGEGGLLSLRLFPQCLAQAVALRLLASRPSEFKCKGSAERGVKKESVSKQGSSRLRYCSQSLVMDRTFFLFLI